ncbi:unnamed protein product [Meganyctiphanes norvegica]|uniref:Uncharacterized protein n=5 Tax=Meganyctiphanes norvegica TaxID=48144 RepID=A0AAV2QMH3_MEGNR
MSPKKSPDVTLHEVESEIAQLAGESPAAPQPSELQSFFKDFLARQDTQHVELLKSLTTSSQQSLQAILSAVQPATTRPQQTSSVAACPSQLDSAPAVVRGLYTPSSMSAIDAVGDWEEVEGDGDGDGHSSDEDQDFEGWSFTPSGKSSSAPPSEAPVAPPVEGTLPSTSASAVPTVPPVLDDELFNVYGLPMNWTLAPELMSWLKAVCSKEVPFTVVKQVNESFVPCEELQPYFVAPALPPAISRLLFTAPKSLSRVPKLVNGALLRVQKELCVAYKPLLEVLNFFYSEAFTFIVESIPDLKDVLARLKLLLSQALAVVISASLKVSKARKHALRPLLKYSSSGILLQNPTSQHVLGSSDLAALSDKATKEHKAVSGCFRLASQNRPRFKTGYQPYNTGYNNYRSYNNKSSNYRYNQGYQDRGSQRKSYRGKSKGKRSGASTSK